MIHINNSTYESNYYSLSWESWASAGSSVCVCCAWWSSSTTKLLLAASFFVRTLFVWLHHHHHTVNHAVSNDGWDICISTTALPVSVRPGVADSTLTSLGPIFSPPLLYLFSMSLRVRASHDEIAEDSFSLRVVRL